MKQRLLRDHRMATATKQGLSDQDIRDIAELLIANGADVNAKSKRGTPLSNAVKSGDKEIVEWWVGQIQSPLSSQIDLLQSTRRRA